MTLLPADTPWLVQHGDCLEYLRHLPDTSVDAVVTDPPAGIEFMGQEWDNPATFGSTFAPHGFTDGGQRLAAPAQRVSLRNPMCQKCHKHLRGAGGCVCAEPEPDEDVEFIGRAKRRQRDAFVAYLQAIMVEVYRVLKPGGHALVWALPRTSHWTALALEEAGFEIRDCTYHFFGSGFPKSLDVSKALDKRGGVSVAWFGPWLEQERTRRGITRKELAAHFPSKQQYGGQEASGGLTGCVSNWETGYSLPTPEQFNKLCEVLELPFTKIEEAEREVLIERTLVQGGGNSLELRMGERREVAAPITAPASTPAQEWAGWGTALKPAVECWWLCRKPFNGTVAENVLKHRTGAINIDGCRVGVGDESIHIPQSDPGKRGGVVGTDLGFSGGELAAFQAAQRESGERTKQLGRWPAHLVLSHTPECRCVGTKEIKAGGGASSGGKETHEVVGRFGHDTAEIQRYDADGKETVEAWECASDCPVRLLDEQSAPGMHGAGVAREAVRSCEPAGMFPLAGDGHRFGDVGGASRFFFTPRMERSCDLCGSPLDFVRGSVETCSAPTAPESSSLAGPANASVPGDALPMQPPVNEGRLVLSEESAKGVDGSSSPSPVTAGSTALPSALTKMHATLAQRVRSVASLCAPCGTATAQSLVAIAHGHAPESLHCLDSMPEPSKSILIQNLARFVALRGNTVTIPTTDDLHLLFGSVRDTIAKNTSSARNDPSTECVPTRFRYVSKPSRSERNLGGVTNSHPTVKALELMRWLVRMVTPPGGLVLDPFTGSGSTGCAAVLEGCQFLGFEREAEYLEIAQGRIAYCAAHPEEFQPRPKKKAVRPHGRLPQPVAAPATAPASADVNEWLTGLMQQVSR